MNENDEARMTNGAEFQGFGVWRLGSGRRRERPRKHTQEEQEEDEEQDWEQRPGYLPKSGEIRPWHF